MEEEDQQTYIKQKKQYQVNCTSYKVLDAPGLQDDYYLNLLDWSKKNILAVALGSQVYVWNGFTNQVSKLCEVERSENTNLVQGLQWSENGDYLSVGDSFGQIQIFDVNNQLEVCSFRNHTDRIGSVAWKDENIIATGSRDKQIVCTDIRTKIPFQTYKGHLQEICGLKWSFDSQMLASGGNDNKLYVWSLRSHNYLHKFTQHKAAVKAIAWNPHQHGLLASGGGTMDKCIRFWNAQTGKCIDQIETNSQVCNLVFSKNQNEFVSTHGFQDNEIIVWKYPTLQKIACLTGHTCRVLQLGLSPCSTKIVTGAGDQTLRFWDIFSQKQTDQQQLKEYSSVLNSKFDLR